MQNVVHSEACAKSCAQCAKLLQNRRVCRSTIAHYYAKAQVNIHRIIDVDGFDNNCFLRIICCYVNLRSRVFVRKVRKLCFEVEKTQVDFRRFLRENRRPRRSEQKRCELPKKHLNEKRFLGNTVCTQRNGGLRCRARWKFAV